MAPLINAQNLSKSFGTQKLFKGLSFTLHEGDRIGLIGPNGSGKSTLMKILVDLEEADEGSLVKRQALKIGYASQSPEFESRSLEEILIQSSRLEHDQALIKARILLSKAQFKDFSYPASNLSGGWKKRLDIVRALMSDPDIVLLDEPTNHLDIEGILWLEKLLKKEITSFIVVSHDRYFLEKVTEKTVELNRCYPQGLFMCDGSYAQFIEKKEEFLFKQAQDEHALTSKLKGEIEWMKRSPKARTTKSRSRVQKAEEMISELETLKIRNQTKKVDFAVFESDRETRKLLSCKNVTKSYGEKLLFKGLDILLSPGSRLGLVGKNGSGKTTLLKILAGLLPQDLGTRKLADGIRCVYFDQHREQISPYITLKEALSPNGEFVHHHGQMIHVNGWAQKFLFHKERLELPVGCLSGGERARIHIAKLMLEPADILFLDEPTNDLDIETLEVIEEQLLEFTGGVVLISHDRCLMDRVCSSIIGLGEDTEEYLFADYTQWEQAIEKKKEAKPIEDKKLSVQPKPAPKKLSYKEQKELEGMEENIQALEAEIASLSKDIEDPSAADPSLYKKLANKQERVDSLYLRWQTLLNHS